MFISVALMIVINAIDIACASKSLLTFFDTHVGFSSFLLSSISLLLAVITLIFLSVSAVHTRKQLEKTDEQLELTRKSFDQSYSEKLLFKSSVFKTGITTDGTKITINNKDEYSIELFNIGSNVAYDIQTTIWFSVPASEKQRYWHEMKHVESFLSSVNQDQNSCSFKFEYHYTGEFLGNAYSDYESLKPTSSCQIKLSAALTPCFIITEFRDGFDKKKELYHTMDISFTMIFREITQTFTPYDKKSFYQKIKTDFPDLHKRLGY